MEKDLNKNNQGGNEGTGTEKKESLLKRFVRGYDRFRTGKVGRWVVRGAKVIGLGCGAAGFIEIGKHLAKPTVVYVEKLPDQTEEAPEEEKTEETTTEA